MKRFVFTVALGLAFCWNGFAQTTSDAPASREDVERYLQVLHSHDMIKQMLNAMSAPMHQMIHDQFVKDQDKLPPDFEARMTKNIDDMLNTMPFDEMMEAMVPAYQKHFTKGDIDALVAFYSGPTGQKVLRELPAITAEAMQSMIPIMTRQMDSMKQKVQQDVAAMMKESGTKPGKHSSTAKN